MRGEREFDHGEKNKYCRFPNPEKVLLVPDPLKLRMSNSRRILSSGTDDDCSVWSVNTLRTTMAFHEITTVALRFISFVKRDR